MKRMVLNESYELQINSIEKVSDGIRVNVESLSMDAVEKVIINSGEIKSLVFVFESGDTFAKYYNLSLAALHKDSNGITVHFKNQSVVASTDVAEELSRFKNLVENYQLSTNNSQELQDEAIGELAEIISNLENRGAEEMEDMI